jgi:hypothetical protein
MIQCEVCCCEKERKEFYRVKHFEKYCRTDKKLCRECQQDYIAIKKQKRLEQKFQRKSGIFMLTFD